MLLVVMDFWSKNQRFPFVLRVSKDENGDHWFMVRQAHRERVLLGQSTLAADGFHGIALPFLAVLALLLILAYVVHQRP